MAEPSAAANAPAIRILHEDDHIVVVDKPTNLLSVPGRHPDAPPPTKKRRRVAEFWVEALEASRASSPPESLAAKLLLYGCCAKQLLSTLHSVDLPSPAGPHTASTAKKGPPAFADKRDSASVFGRSKPPCSANSCSATSSL